MRYFLIWMEINLINDFLIQDYFHECKYIAFCNIYNKILLFYFEVFCKHTLQCL